MTETSEHIDQKLLEILKTVSDPEIPVLSIIDMGVVRSAKIVNEIVEVQITPTYSGCPATDLLKQQIQQALNEQGFEPVRVLLDLSEAWTTDWMSEQGKQKLQAYGIAPPQGQAEHCGTHVALSDGVACPHCKSSDTRLLSEFSSTACKALYQCRNCLEPFDYFKCI